MTLSTDSISSVIIGMLRAAQEENVSSFRAVADLPEVASALKKAEAGDCKGFYYGLIYPLTKAIDGLLGAAVPASQPARFILKHSSFFENHFRAVIERREGSACAADKTSFLVCALLKFHMTGQEIAINREQEYTYHLPSTVFLTHADIVAFGESLMHLHYGRPEKFILELQKTFAPPISKEAE